jgi:hypothetical protein
MKSVLSKPELQMEIVICMFQVLQQPFETQAANASANAYPERKYFISAKFQSLYFVRLHPRGSGRRRDHVKTGEINHRAKNGS